MLSIRRRGRMIEPMFLDPRAFDFVAALESEWAVRLPRGGVVVRMGPYEAWVVT
jgi:hypothetical protein